MIPTLSQMNPVHTPFQPIWRSILLISSHLRLGLPFRISDQNSVCISYISHASIHLSLLSWHSRIFGEYECLYV
jgi:hypothetical protein